jgi:PPOX class probable FMN-dependent enzyme
MTAPFRDVVTSEQELRALLGHPSDLALKKQIDTLDEHCRAFIAQSPFLLLATSDASGRCDVSPKGDPPGFVHVVDDTHLVIPDRPGNRRLDGMRNILQNPHVGIIFLVPGRDSTLRVNGRAAIVRDSEILDRLAVEGKRPHFGIGVTVEEVFLHCVKAFRRSKLWRSETWPDPSALASMACMLLDQAKPAESLAELEQRLDHSARTTLY